MKKGTIFLIVVSLVLLSLLILLLQMDRTSRLQVWNKKYGGEDHEEAWSLIQTDDQGYAIIGNILKWTSGPTDLDFWFVKTDSAGNMQWNKTYGGTEDDEATSIIQTSDGGYTIAGYTNSFGAVGSDLWLVKTDSNGNKLWSKTYGGTSNDGALSAIQTIDKGYALAGATNSFGAGGFDFWLVKTDSDGNMQWNKTYGGANDDCAWSVIQKDDGGYALVGETNSYGADNYDCWLVRTDSAGNIQWNKTYGGASDDYAYSMVQTSDGGYALAGSTDNDFWLVKTDSDGNMQWNKTYGGTCGEAYSLVQTNDGGYTLAGDNSSYRASGWPLDFLLIKTDANGNHLLNQTYEGAPTLPRASHSTVHTNDGGYAMAGGIISNETLSEDFLLVKTDAHLSSQPVSFWAQWWFWLIYGGVPSVSLASYLLTTKRKDVSSWLHEIKSAKQKKEMEKAVLDYVQRHQGKINVKECAKRLGLVEEQVKETLSRLEEKGFIKTKK